MKGAGLIVQVLVCVAERVRSQALVSHHVLLGPPGLSMDLHFSLSDHVTRSTNDNITE